MGGNLISPIGTADKRDIAIVAWGKEHCLNPTLSFGVSQRPSVEKTELLAKLSHQQAR
jgi:hypothetical protein